MAASSPEDLMNVFHEHISTLQETVPITPAIRHKMREDLSEVYNYLSGLHRKPSFERVVRSQSAHLSNQRKEAEKERSLLEAHRAFVETNLEKADQYLRTIQLAGYAAFFAIWGFSDTYIGDTQAKSALLLMIFSAFVFVGWEIWKATLISLSLKRHASITSDAETFARNRFEKVIAKQMTLELQSRNRFIVWIYCIITATLSVLIMLFSIVTSLFS